MGSVGLQGGQQDRFRKFVEYWEHMEVVEEGPQEQMLERFVVKSTGLPVAQVVEEVDFTPQARVQHRPVERDVDLPVPEIQEEEIVWTIHLPHQRMAKRFIHLEQGHGPERVDATGTHKAVRGVFPGDSRAGVVDKEMVTKIVVVARNAKAIPIPTSCSARQSSKRRERCLRSSIVSTAS